MKILFIQTNYSSFLANFHKKHSGKRNLSYEKLKKLWEKELFGLSSFYSQNISGYGWEAEDIIANDWPLQSRWAKEHGHSIKKGTVPLLKYLPEYIKNRMGLRKWIKSIVFAQIKFYNPDVVYAFDLSLFNKNDIAYIKKNCGLVVAQTASVLRVNESTLKAYDLMISSFPHYVEKFRKLGINSEYLRWCFEPRVIKRIKSRRRKYDVVYVGGFTRAHSEGNKYLEALAKHVQIDFWGYGTNWLSPIRKHYQGQAWGKEMYEIFAQAKITINRHINVAGKYANNMRMFEATGMGSLLITDHKENIREFFKPGKEIVTYKTSQELIKKTKYYLKHPKEAQKIARAGQKRALKDHTYKIRMKRLDKILRKYLETA